MDLMVKLYLDRANNEHLLAGALKKLSETDTLKKEFGLPEKITFYSAAISHAYYAIFYSAKAALLTKGIETKSPEIHKKTFEEFKKQFVESGILDTELLIIYQKMIIRADELLQIFKNVKKIRHKSGFLGHKKPESHSSPTINNGAFWFFREKWKRGHFTYETIPQANKKPAEESVEHATKFVKNIRAILEE